MSKSNKSYIFKDEIYEEMLSKMKRNFPSFINQMKRFFDKNSHVLTSSSMSSRLYFTDKDRASLFKVGGISPNKIKKTIKDTGVTDPSWIIYNKPENWIFVCLIKFATDHRVRKDVDMVLMYYTCYLYSSIQSKYFQFANENVMDYTINNLSNKFDIKALGNLQKALYKLCVTCYETYIDYFQDFTDLNIKNFSMNLWTRVNNMVRGVAEEYYKNVEDGNYLNKETESRSEEDYYEVDNVSNIIENLVGKSTSYVTGQGVDYSLAQLSAKMAGVSLNVTRSSLQNMLKNEVATIPEFYRNLLIQYLINDGGDPRKITSKDFITYSNRVYSRGNNASDEINKIKDLLNTWLEDNSEKYNKTERVATKSNFRKSIYFYFIFSLQKTQSVR